MFMDQMIATELHRQTEIMGFWRHRVPDHQKRTLWRFYNAPHDVFVGLQATHAAPESHDVCLGYLEAREALVSVALVDITDLIILDWDFENLADLALGKKNTIGTFLAVEIMGSEP